MHDTVALLYDTKPPKLYRTALHIRDYQLEAAPVVVLYRLQVSHYQNQNFTPQHKTAQD